MYCTSCGAEMRETDRFCASCGRATGSSTAGDTPNPTVHSSRRLTRLMSDRKIGGVCAGFAYYLDVDVTIVRLVWIAVALTTGVGFLAYLIAWLVMPTDYSLAAPRTA